MARHMRIGVSARFIVWFGLFASGTIAVLVPQLIFGFDALKTLVGLILAYGAAVATGVALERFFFRDLRSVIDHAKKQYSTYDLTGRLRLHGSSESAELGRAINGFAARVQGTIYDLMNVTRRSMEIAEHLSGTAEGMVTASCSIGDRMEEISTASESLSESLVETDKSVDSVRRDTDSIASRIQDQASAVTQTSAAVQEMIANINTITRVVNDRTGVGSKIEEMRAETEGKFAEFSETIRIINGTVGSIGESISVIRDMADKSNILAMNAAIEAAHAGEAGKGFSVVAEELRSLSENTQENSLTISADLESIIANFERASGLSEATDRLLGSFIREVRGFMDGMGQIGQGLNEMNIGTTEILEALGTLNGVTNEVEAASGRISTLMGDFKARFDALERLGENNMDFARRSKAASAGISEVTLELSLLGNRNGAMFDLMLEKLGAIKLLDLSTLKASDNQPLMFWSLEKKTVPQRPERPESFPETDKRRWHDYEYSGWGVVKAAMPPSPMDGARGKRVYYLLNTQDSETLTYAKALVRGARKMADLHGISLSMRFANIDARTQAKQVEEALAAKPDLVIIEPTDARATVTHVKRLYQARIPVIISLMSVEQEAYPYILCYTGPDDWSQTRSLARSFADRIGKEGSYCILQHVPGSGTDYGRTFGALTELAEYAPRMRFLEKAYAGFEIEPVREQVSKWLVRFGRDLKGIMVADDGYMITGAVNAVQQAGRDDIVICSAGNSKNGMDLVKAGKAHSITYQSAESTSALPLAAAAEYFDGLELPPVKNLPVRLITKANVEEFYPPQF